MYLYTSWIHIVCDTSDDYNIFIYSVYDRVRVFRTSGHSLSVPGVKTVDVDLVTKTSTQDVSGSATPSQNSRCPKPPSLPPIPTPTQGWKPNWSRGDENRENIKSQGWFWLKPPFFPQDDNFAKLTILRSVREFVGVQILRFFVLRRDRL